MVHLVTPRVNRQLGLVSFIQNLPSKLLTTGNHCPVLVFHQTLLVNAEVWTTAFSHQLFDVGNLQVIIPFLRNDLLE
jgi:Na+/phosphate symporter